jgi:hypothetical protein
MDSGGRRVSADFVLPWYAHAAPRAYSAPWVIAAFQGFRDGPGRLLTRLQIGSGGVCGPRALLAAPDRCGGLSRQSRGVWRAACAALG